MVNDRPEIRIQESDSADHKFNSRIYLLKQDKALKPALKTGYSSNRLNGSEVLTHDILKFI